jgi:hypothetical protein
MLSAHKIQESLATFSQLFSPLPWDHIEEPDLEVLKDQENYIKRASEMLDAAVKFDIGEINPKNSQALFSTGKECAEEGLLNLPFETTYVEANFVYDTFKRRCASVFAPVSACLDETLFGRIPDFIGGTAALNFTFTREFCAAKGSWKVPTLISIFSRDFSKTCAVPAAKELTEYAAMTKYQRLKTARINTTMLYIMHSLINARGVELQTESAPIRLNRKRVQQNKPPLYEHHVLKIGGYSSNGRVLGVGASHASPRAHWRRGHIRTIHRGTPKQKRIAIPVTFINGPGFISKDYEVSQ